MIKHRQTVESSINDRRRTLANLFLSFFTHLRKGELFTRRQGLCRSISSAVQEMPVQSDDHEQHRAIDTSTIWSTTSVLLEEKSWSEKETDCGEWHVISLDELFCRCRRVHLSGPWRRASPSLTIKTNIKVLPSTCPIREIRLMLGMKQ